jgi:8-oxo-dGTP pyrophosphatase MutT (NUDIX family)
MTLFERLERALHNGHTREVDLIPGDGNHTDRPTEIVPAAVLVAVTDRETPGVILTQRPETMRKHPGQVAFPGGRMDETDASLIAAALREAEEEVALPPNRVTIIGTTDPYRTITGYEVTPVIGIVPPDLPLRANEGEVAGIFEAPLDFLLNPANHEWQEAEYKGKTRRFFEIHWEDRRIWGATAAMIVNLSRRLQWHG